MKNEIRRVELMITLAEDRTLYNALPVCQEKHLLGLDIVECNAELLDLGARKGELRSKSAETAAKAVASVTITPGIAPKHS